VGVNAGLHRGEAELERFAQQLRSDAGLRNQFRQDPVGTAQRSGLSLTDEDRGILLSMGWDKMSDEELIARAGTSAWIKPM
jgi:hypothetical protein